jgi:hypothetical protein
MITDGWCVMARARNIKPGFFSNEFLADLPVEARLLFIGLWTLADRCGRLEDRPKGIGGKLFPFDEFDTNSLLDALANSPERFIIRYSADGRRYIQISNFEKHQNPHIKESESTIPAPCLYGASTGNSGTSPADSLLLIPDSLLLIPDSPIPIPPLTPPGGNAPCGAEAGIAVDDKGQRSKVNRQEILRGELFAVINGLTMNLEVRQAAQDWVESRLAREKRDWPSVRAVELAFSKIRTWGYDGKRAAECFAQSVINGWKGLFPLNGG